MIDSVRRRFLSSAAALTVAVATAPASAQAGGSAALAEELFRDGKALLEQGTVPEACRKLEESQRLDPGGGTLLVLALCHEQEGKTATAWSEFQQSLSLARAAKREDRERVAAARIAVLEPKLSRLTLEVEPQQGVDVRLDGTAIGTAAWGTAMPVDPGTHTVTATAPGRSRWTQTVAVGADGDTRVVRIPLLAREASPDRGQETSSTRRVLGFAIGGTGIVAIGVGAFFGIRAFDKQAESEDGCIGGVCDEEGFAAHEAGKTAATVSTIALGAGVALVGVGVYFLVSSADGDPEPASSQPGPAVAIGTSIERGAPVVGLSARW